MTLKTMYRMLLGLVLVFLPCWLLVSTPGEALAQVDAGQSLEEGKAAFREERYDAAERLLLRAAEQDPQHAETHFVLARLYFESPLQDYGKARWAIDKALELEPNNVEYLTARLIQYRTDSWSFLGERIKEARRLETSRAILKLDPDNPFAHEEMGLVNIREFWRYRNSIMMPGLNYGYVGEQRQTAAIEGDLVNPDNLSLDELIQQGEQPATAELVNNTFVDVSQVFLGDKFNVRALESQGVPVQDLSLRAENAYRRAIAHLEKALEVDPRRRVVYDKMMQIFSLKGEYDDALAMLEEMYAFFPEDPDLWRYLGIAEYKLGNPVAADRSFSTAFEFMDEEEKRAYEDLSLFLSRQERALREQDPVAFNARYWTSKDPRYLTTYNERKLEHYYRLTYADLLYSAPALNLRGWETERGRIMVRYGPPPSDVVLRPSVDGVFSARNLLVGALLETIQGSNAEGAQTSARTLQGTSSFGVFQTTAAAAFEENNAYNIWDYGDFRFVFEDPFKNGEYRMYSPPAEEAFAEINSWMNDYAMLSKETIARTPELYSYEAPGRQIDIPFLVTSFRGEDAATDLYVHYGIPLNEYDRDKDFVEITANTGTFLISEDRDILVERRRTIYGLPLSQVVAFEEQELWVDSQLMQAPPGSHELSVEFETVSGLTVAVQRRDVEVPEFRDGELGLSDVMLAYAVEDAPDGEPLGSNEIVRSNLSIKPAPWSVYSSSWPIYLYFEVYELELGTAGRTDYDVEITLTPKDMRRGLSRTLGRLLGGRRQGVSVSYDGSGTETRENLYQILDASRQEPGLYTLHVAVTDNVTGASAEREQDLFLEN